MDPFDMLNDAVKDLSDKVYGLVAGLASVKGQLKIVFWLLALIVAGIVGNFFYEMRGL